MNIHMLEILDNQKKNFKTPIWLMRQAGRYLPEYRELRSKTNNFLEFCYNVELASEVTLQPMRRFNLDAAIIFSDILVIPDSIGINVNFHEQQGPILDPIQDINQLELAFKKTNKEKLNSIYQAITKVRKDLLKDKALIGFSGGAWTLASYIVEGKLSRDLSKIKSIYYKDKKFIELLIMHLVENISEHLIKQIQAGVDLIQIFDSWAGMVTEEDYNDLIIKPTKLIIKKVRKIYPNIPIICFPRMSGINYERFCNEVDCNAVSIDQYMPLSWIKERKNGKILQGNLDPLVLLSESEKLIKERVDHIFNQMEDENFIFNLGHGVVPQISPEMVEVLINYVKEKR